MKGLIFIFWLCTANCVAQHANTGRDSVLKYMATQQDAWNRGDVKGFMDHYWKSDSLKFIGSRGITCGWHKTLDSYLKSYPDKTAMGSLKFTIIEATALSETAVYVIGKWELQKEKPAGGYFTLMWKKVNGRWVIVSDHTS